MILFYIGDKSWQWTFATAENNITQLKTTQTIHSDIFHMPFKRQLLNLEQV